MLKQSQITPMKVQSTCINQEQWAAVCGSDNKYLKEEKELEKACSASQHAIHPLYIMRPYIGLMR